ncbi:MAG TPA: hypothetical protein VLK82_26530 [Candidatus Tectomicrobia bacterium]|nr:hypothetical protein [Candidatus Tectomicrobia bacterium]
MALRPESIFPSHRHSEYPRVVVTGIQAAAPMLVEAGGVSAV